MKNKNYKCRFPQADLIHRDQMMNKNCLIWLRMKLNKKLLTWLTGVIRYSLVENWLSGLPRSMGACCAIQKFSDYLCFFY